MAKHYSWKVGEPLPVLGAHSLAKHQVFETYTSRYIHILSPMLAKRELNLTIVDGFCGGGAYSFQNSFVAGSPLLLLRSVQAAEVELAAARQHGFKVKADFFFIDQNKHHTEFLQSELENSEFSKDVGKTIHIKTDSFNNQARGIISAVKAKGPSHRALFFLDQYGWSAVSFGVVRHIFENLNNPEVIITFSVDTLINYMTEETAKAKSGQAIDLDPELGNVLSGLRTENGQRAVIQGFLYRHILKNTGAIFYTPFFIRSPVSNRSYWLLHLSKHARARDEMARLHWGMTNTFVHPGGAGFNALGYDPSIDPNQISLEFDFGSDARVDSTNAAVQQMPKLIRDDSAADGEPVSLKALFEANCNETPLTMELVSDAVVRLRDDLKEVDVFGQDGKPKPRAAKLSSKDLVRARQQRSFLKTFGR